MGHLLRGCPVCKLKRAAASGSKIALRDLQDNDQADCLHEECRQHEGTSRRG